MDGVEVSVTTSKIITDNDTKNEEMRFLRYSPAFICIHTALGLNFMQIPCKYIAQEPDCVEFTSLNAETFLLIKLLSSLLLL